MSEYPKVFTQHPVAIESLDHIYPLGTKNDNTTSSELIREIEEYFGNRKINVLDIGCAGGQFIVDMHTRGHLAVGIEGSDYSVQHQRANWPTYHNKCLFTCDATKPFEIVDKLGVPLLFDCIMAWEVLEHIRCEDHAAFFTNINKHLKPTGFFIGSVSLHAGDPQHVTVLPEAVWREGILSKHFGAIGTYPFHAWLREDVRASSFVFMGTKKW